MSLPEGYLPREGDVLVLHVTVEHDVETNERGVFVLIPPNKYNAEIIPLRSFVGVKRRQWKEGEKVRHRNIDKCFGEVVAMDGDFVWVRLGDNSIRPKRSLNGFMTAHCNEIEIDPIAVGIEALRQREEDMKDSDTPPSNPVIQAIAGVAEVVKPKEEPDVAF